MKRILIIEDDLIVRQIYRRKFEMSGYKVETAEEGAAGLALMPDFKPDVIQVDIMLPGMDGVEVIRRLRATEEFKNTPVLVLSSFYRPDLAKEAWKAGANKCVSKMDCTPNLALDLVEQLLAKDGSGFTQRYGEIPLAKDALDASKEQVSMEAPGTFAETASGPGVAEPPAQPTIEMPKLRINLNLPPSAHTAPSLPSFQKKATEPSAEAPPQFFGGTVPAPYKQPARAELERAPSVPAPAAPAPATPAPAPTPAPALIPAPATPAPGAGAAASDFRVEIRQEFLRRAPQIQAELRDRVGALIKSKSTSDQLNLLRELAVCVGSLASLSGITGFSRISHLSGALDALIQELHKKPNQMTASVLRTIAHASDCLDVLFRDLNGIAKDIPQSMLILAVDDEPISRRTVAIALGKANLRCIRVEDPRMALTILTENPFDLIFLDADMPVLNGFELCAEIRKMPTNKTTPVIFVTGMPQFEVRAKSSLSGGNDLIAKPFLMMELAVKALTYLLKPASSGDARAKVAV
jgi:CheY-like chemotaxis protein